MEIVFDKVTLSEGQLLIRDFYEAEGMYPDIDIDFATRDEDDLYYLFDTIASTLVFPDYSLLLGSADGVLSVAKTVNGEITDRILKTSKSSTTFDTILPDTKTILTIKDNENGGKDVILMYDNTSRSRTFSSTDFIYNVDHNGYKIEALGEKDYIQVTIIKE